MKDIYFSKFRTNKLLRIPKEVYEFINLEPGDVVLFKINPDKSISFGKADIKINGE